MGIDEFIRSYFPDAKMAGSQFMALCPAHDDKTPSLSIGQGDDGKLLLNCFAGCSTQAVCQAKGVPVSALMGEAPSFSPKSIGKSKPRIIATYPYQDESGNTLSEVVRFDPKDFRQRRPDGKGCWNWSVKDVRVVPYHLPRLLADPSRVVCIVEGEKDVHALEDIGCVATCNAGGALKWTPDHAVHLKDRNVVILPDNDNTGQEHAELVASSLVDVARCVKVVRLPNLPEKGDVSDWIAAGGTKEQLRQLAEEALLWEPGQQSWPEIDSLDDKNLPSFPTFALPSPLQDWVAAESEATQTPEDLAGLLCLATCGAAIAGKVRIEARPGYQEPTNLFVIAVLDPGNRKSAVFSDATRPLREIEAELVEAARPELARLKSERRQEENRLRNLEKKGATDTSSRHEAIELAAELAEQPTPELPRLIVDDVTGERIGMFLASQGGRIASMSPEGNAFDLMAGMYSKNNAPQMDVYLKGHSGDDLTTDRVGRESVHVERPALTCAYTIQVSVIESWNDTKAFRGRGLLARFLFAMPTSWIGRRKIASPPVPDHVTKTYGTTIRRLFAKDQETTVRLSPSAQDSFQAWEAEIESLLDEGGDLSSIRDWGAKLAGATLRIAGILHCVQSGPELEVEAGTIESAIQIGHYLIPHAEAVFDKMNAQDDSLNDGARYVLRWIRRNELRTFQKRDAHQHGKRKFRKVEDLDVVLEEMVRRGYIRSVPTETNRPGRPPSPTYEVNPAIFENLSKNRSQNSWNSPSGNVSEGSGNIEDAFQMVKNSNRVQVTI